MENKISSIFSDIYQKNLWQDPDSKSGTGSNLIQTQVIREEIPALLRAYQIKTMLDAPCGDYFWMKEIQGQLKETLDQYIGADIVPDIVALNNANYEDAQTKFIQLDIVNQTPPQVDLIFSRDCLVHLSFSDTLKALKGFKKSGAMYLLTTTFTQNRHNKDIQAGNWRPLNFYNFPFQFPQALCIINENCTEDNGIYSDKSLALWRIQDLPIRKLQFNLIRYTISQTKNRLIKRIKQFLS